MFNPVLAWWSGYMAGNRNFLMLAGFGILSFYAGFIVGSRLLNLEKSNSAEDGMIPSIVKKNSHRIIGRANVHIVR